MTPDPVALSEGRTDEVWWSDGGSKLHRHADCPPMRRAISRQAMSFALGRWAGDTVHCYDFAGQAGQEPYPPERYLLCGLCGRG